MKCLKNKSIIAAGLTALSALALGVGAIASGTATEGGAEFSGLYNLTAYAEESSSTGVNQITIAGKAVDFIDSAQIYSEDGEYALCLTVIDMADFGADFTTPLQVGYEIAKDLYFNGLESGLSNVVYSSLTFANGTLKISDLSLSDSFTLPYFIVAEVPVSVVNNEIFNFIVAEKHTTEPVSGQAATCTADGWNDYYACTDCDKYFTDSWGLHEIADLAAWKTGEGKIEAFGHTEVIDEAIAATCTEAGLTEGKHCSVCGEILVAQSVVKALGHTEVIDEAKAATCTETGLTEGKHCSVCGEVLEAQSVVEATGHTYLDEYEDEYCTVCHDHKEVVKTVNGVNYTLAYDTESGVSRYFVASGKAEDFNSLYTGEGAQTLVLENEIDGFSVTEIGESAFANTDGNPIKSVIVPANIVTVGMLAFHNNVDMQSAVFLAPEVFVKGTYYNNSDGNTTPFYGCNISGNEKKTVLNVYYNAIKYGNSTADLGWTRFYQYSVGAGLHYRYCIAYDDDGSAGTFGHDGGGARITSGWSYVNLTVNNNTPDNYDFESIVKGYVTEGLNPNTIYNAEEIRNSIQSELDVLSTNEEKCLKYQVTVESFKDDFGTTQIVVNVDETQTTYYLLTLTSATMNDNGDAVGGISVTGNYKEYNGAIYAANVTLTSDEVTGYQFGKFVCNGVEVSKDSYNLTLDTDYQVSVYYEEKPITVYVISEVSFTHAGSQYSANGDKVSISKDNVDIQPIAEGYVFLGWAQGSESLEFTTISTEDGATYYAIWGVNNNSSVNGYSYNQSGTLPQDLTATDGTFYKWYTDAAFSTEVSAISAQNTVLYARWQYVLEVTFNYQNSTFHITDNYQGEVGGEPIKWENDLYSGVSSFSVPLLEGQSISLGYSATGTVKYTSWWTTYYEDYTFAILTITENGETVKTWAVYADNNKTGNGTMRDFGAKDSNHEFGGNWVEKVATAAAGLSLVLYV